MIFQIVCSLQPVHSLLASWFSGHEFVFRVDNTYAAAAAAAAELITWLMSTRLMMTCQLIMCHAASDEMHVEDVQRVRSDRMYSSPTASALWNHVQGTKMTGGRASRQYEHEYQLDSARLVLSTASIGSWVQGPCLSQTLNIVPKC